MCYLLLVPWVCVCDVPFFFLGGGSEGTEKGFMFGGLFTFLHSVTIQSGA